MPNNPVVMPLPPTHRIFLSSTSVDLHDWRSRLDGLLPYLGQFSVVMDRFSLRPLGSIDATDLSLDELSGCQVYILLLGWRYGYVPDGQKLSVTHQEYQAARKNGMTCYAFLAHPDTAPTEAPNGTPVLFPASVRDPEHHEQLLAFRAEVERDGIVGYFTTADDLANKAVGAIHRYLLYEQWSTFLQDRRPPRRLPLRAPGFVGRETELATLTETVLSGQSTGLSALVNGMGGVGKSALAAEVLYRLAQDPTAFPAGIGWVRCDGRTGDEGLIWVYDQLLATWDASLAPEVVAQATTPQASIRLREQQLTRVFHPFPLTPEIAASGDGSSSQTQAPAALILLDNVEVDFPLTTALETLASLHATVLLTARHRPANERLRVVSLNVLSSQASVALFHERYSAKGGDWQQARDAPATAQVAQQLGYLPLAIELAASRAALRQMSVADLAAELAEAQRLGFLNDPTDPNRSKSNVRYNLTRSLEALTPVQRLRFAAFGLLSGADWPRDVIESLLDGILETPAAAESPSSPAADDLDLLAAFSLVTLGTSSAPSASEAADAAISSVTTPPPDRLRTPRVRLHPLLRDLAREEWRQFCAQDPSCQEAGVLALMNAVHVFISQHQEHLAVLAQEEDLVVGAINEAAAVPVAYQSCNQAIQMLTGYLYLRGRWQLGQTLLERQLFVLRRLGDRRGEGVALTNLANLTLRLGQFGESRRCLDQSLHLFQEIGDQEGEIITLDILGTLAENIGEYAAARHYLDQALAISRTSGNRRLEGASLNALGMLAQRLERYDEARQYYEASLVIHREVGNKEGEAATLSNLGGAAQHLKAYDDARRYLEQALPLNRAMGNLEGEAAAMSNLGLLAQNLEKYDEARRYYEQALSIFQATGNRRGEGITLDALGGLAQRTGVNEQVLHYYEQALSIFRTIGDRAGEASNLSELGSLMQSLGRYDVAQRYLEQALPIVRTIGDQRRESIVLDKLGNIMLYFGQYDAARHFLEQALKIAHDIGAHDGEAAVLTNMGHLAQRLGQKEQARRCYEQALSIYQKIGAVDYARTVAANLQSLA